MTTPNTYTRTLPNEPGFYWWRKDEKAEAINVRVHNHFDQLKADFYQSWKGLMCLPVSDMPGLWLRDVAPELPGEESVKSECRCMPHLRQLQHDGLCLHCKGYYRLEDCVALDELRAKYHAEVAPTQREIRESSQMTAADMSVRVGSSEISTNQGGDAPCPEKSGSTAPLSESNAAGSTSHPSALPQETPTPRTDAMLAEHEDRSSVPKSIALCRTLERELADLAFALLTSEKTGRQYRDAALENERELAAAKEALAQTADLRAQLTAANLQNSVLMHNYEQELEDLRQERSAARVIMKLGADLREDDSEYLREVHALTAERDAALAQVAEMKASFGEIQSVTTDSSGKFTSEVERTLAIAEVLRNPMNPLDSPSKPQ